MDESPIDDNQTELSHLIERRASEIDSLRQEIDELRHELESFEREITDRTVHRDRIKADLHKYIRRRVTTARARGWGPYIVLLYGTVMTIGAFYYLNGGWAILAMIVIWLSTLGLYVLMVIVGIGLGTLDIPSRVYDRIDRRR